MKKLCNILLLELSIVLFSSSLFALDMEKATNAYFSFQEELSHASMAEKKRTRSTSQIIMEAYVVSGTLGLISVSKDNIAGPLSDVALRSIATTLYETNNYGLYLFQDFKVQVWYENNLASVITMMAYTD